MRFLRPQIGNCRIWADQKCSGLLPLAALALRGPEEALWWLWSQLPRYSFCGICGNELEGLALIARGRKSPFPRWPALHHLFCCHIAWRGDTQKGHLGCRLSLYDPLLLLRSGLYSGVCRGIEKRMLPRSPSLANILGKLPCSTLGGIREEGKSNQGLGGMELSQSGMPSGLPLVRLHPALVVEPGGTSKMPVSVRDRLS